jgi:Asp-tRNA(Asn)/Glu-tRNA(Gln) amidotransferase A subunit family amidase
VTCPMLLMCVRLDEHLLLGFVWPTQSIGVTLCTPPLTTLTTVQVWLATGTDLGGSLRIHASYCGIVGMQKPQTAECGIRPKPCATLRCAVTPIIAQVWLATGTDLGGSLRNPASYCGIVGMRNTVGLVPEARFNSQHLLDRALPYWRLQSVSGVLARTAADLALGLDAVVGQHPGDPV